MYIIPSSQIVPVHAAGQEHVNPFSSSSQVPPLEQNCSVQSSIFSLQSLPVSPSSHKHTISPVKFCRMQDPAPLQIVLSQSTGIGAISVNRNCEYHGCTYQLRNIVVFITVVVSQIDIVVFITVFVRVWKLNLLLLHCLSGYWTIGSTFWRVWSWQCEHLFLQIDRRQKIFEKKFNTKLIRCFSLPVR